MTFDISKIQDIYPFKSRFFNISGQKMHYIDEGKGEPFVMVHGNPSWSFLYRELILKFRNSFRMVALDHIGCGLSDKPSDGQYTYTLKNRIDDLEKLVQHLDFSRRINLVVHDWGGPIGFGLATRRPDLIKRIFVFNTAAFRLPTNMPFPWPLWAFRNLKLGEWLNQSLNLFSLITAKTSTRKQMDEKVFYGFTGPYNSWDERIAVTRFVQDIPLIKGDFAFEELVQIEEGLDKLRRIPMFVGWGKHDFIFSRGFFLEWKKRFPEALFKVYDAGHYLLEDASQEIFAEIEEFIKNT
ncbi:MAG: alpha/beta fold hydrolase [Candidatus Riflebacteria bacterium]|nr:alpha/beta fold hydrolase [Candidatus Riflebacteria bacterium]